MHASTLWTPLQIGGFMIPGHPMHGSQLPAQMRLVDVEGSPFGGALRRIGIPANPTRGELFRIHKGDSSPVALDPRLDAERMNADQATEGGEVASCGPIGVPPGSLESGEGRLAMKAPSHRTRPLAAILERHGLELIGVIGSGRFGRVLQVRDPLSRRSLALKVSRGRRADRLLHEARALRDLRHPGVVELVAAGRAGRLTYVLLDWVDGEPWSAAWAGASESEQVDWVVQLLRALNFVHERGFVHADLSDANVLVTRGNTRRVRLIDFGLATPLTKGTSRSALQGATPRTAAPEVLRGSPSDGRADLFAVGALVLEASGLLATGVLAATWIEQAGDGWVKTLAKRVPAALHPVLPDLLAGTPDGRPSSSWQAIEKIGEALGEKIPLDSESGSIAYARPRADQWSTDSTEALIRRAGQERSKKEPLLWTILGAPGSGESEILEAVEQAALLAGHEVQRFESRMGDAPGEPLRRAGLDCRLVPSQSFEERRESEEAARARAVDQLRGREGWLLFEGIDSADELTRSMFAELQRALIDERFNGRDPGVRLISTSARTVPGEELWAQTDRKVGHGDWRARLELETLEAPVVERWLGEGFRVAGRSAALWATELVRCGDGRIASVQALLERAITAGRITPGVEAWSLTASPALDELSREQGLPASAVAATPALAALLGLLAVSDQPVSADVLREAMGDGDESLASRLAEGRERRLITDRLGPKGSDVTWWEPGLGIAWRETLAPRGRKRSERALAEALESNGFVAEAAELWFAAAETDRALTILEKGFESLVARHDLQRAFALGTRGYRPLLSREEERAVRLALRLSDVALRLGEPKTAERWLVGASRRTCVQSGALRAELERRRAEAACERGQYREAVSACGRARVEAGTDLEVLRIARLEAFALSLLGEHGAAVAVCRGVSDRRVLAAETEAAAIANIEALSELRLGSLDRAEAASRRGLVLARSAGSEPWIAALENTSGLLARRRGDIETAGNFFASALARFESTHALKKVAHCRNNLGIISAELGDFAAAERQHRTALAIFERLGDPYGTAAFTGSLAIDRLRRGCPVLARLGLDEALRLLRGVTAPREETLMRIHQALAYVRTGDRHRAHRSLERSAAAIEAEELEAERTLWLVPALELAGIEGDSARFHSLWESIDPPRPDEIEVAGLRARVALGDEAGSRAALANLEATVGGPRRPETSWMRYVEALLRSDEWAPAARLDRLDELLGETQDVALRAACGFALAQLHRSAGQSGRADDWSLRARRELALVCQGATEEETGSTVMAFRKLTGLMGPELDVEFAGTAARASAPASLADLEEVYEVTRRLNSEDNPKRLMTFILDTAVRLTLAERGFLVLRRRRGLRFVVARDAQQNDIITPDHEVSHSILDDVLESGQSVVTTDAGGDARFQAAASVEALDLTSVVCVPFRVGDQVLGALYLDNPYRKGLFSERELRLAEAFSDQSAIAYRNLRERNRIRRLNRELRDRVVQQDRELRETRRELADGRVDRFGSLIGTSDAMRRVFQLIERLSRTDLSVLIEGESGTGKELVAQEVHRRSRRSSGPFLSENCSAIPRELLESEFFGHVKGAFTGATENRDGLFVLASGGTLFLDEIGDMDLELQKKLLRVLQEGEVRPVGGKKTKPIDVRILTATHRDLRAMIEAGEFREDLYYRINVASIRLPTLRSRRDDIDPLIDHFLALLAEKEGVEKKVSPALRARLRQSDWPGNVRQLENEVARLHALSDGVIDDPSLLSESIGSGASRAALAEQSGELPSLADLERAALQETLDATRWDKEEAARILGISRTSVYAKIKKYELKPGSEG